MFKIIMTGMVSGSSMLILRKGLIRNCREDFTLDFFCTYSEYNIPIGSAFTRFHNRKTNYSINVNAILVDVTQQWSIPFDSIPNGNRTVARIEFNEMSTVILIKKEMPITHRWEDGTNDFVLS